MNVRWHNFTKQLFEQAGEGQGGGSGGSAGGTSLFTAPANGGKAADGAGDAGASSGTGAGANGKAGDGAGGNGSEGNSSADWRSALPKELQEDATLKKFTSVHALAGAYVNAQKLIGRDKIVVPGESTTEEQWNEIFDKLGRPKELKDYAVKFQEGVSLDQKFADDFKAVAHKHGILPKQAQALADWFSGVNKGSEETVAKMREDNFKQTVTNLKTEWGKAFDMNVQRTNKLLHEVGGEELMTHFNTLGLGGDEKTFKFLAKVAEKIYGEHKTVGENNGESGVRTPKEIQSEINKIMNDKGHPYFVKDHPQHKQAVQELQNLYKDLYNKE